MCIRDSVYTALNSETEKKALELIGHELRSLLEDGVTAEELDCAREQTLSLIHI